MSDKVTHKDKLRELGWDDEWERKTAPWGTRWLDRLMWRGTVNNEWMQRVSVDRDDAKRRSFRRSVVLRSIAAALLFVLVTFPEAFDTMGYSVVRGLILGSVIAQFVLLPWWRARAYETGWRKGRLAMRYSMMEAMQRNMTIQQWFYSEMARDYGGTWMEDDDDDER